MPNLYIFIVKNMSGNTFGSLFTVTTFGESHGPAMGVVIDGVPPLLDVSLDDLKAELAKRRPGKKGTSARLEIDSPEILSGVFEGKTLGTPIAIIVRNTDQRPKDYEALRTVFRP